MDAEFRGPPQQLMNATARIDCGDDGPLIHCRIRELSSDQATIEIGSRRVIPNVFVLLIAGKHKASPRCRIVWRNGGQVCLKFQHPLALGCPSAPAPVDQAVQNQIQNAAPLPQSTPEEPSLPTDSMEAVELNI